MAFTLDSQFASNKGFTSLSASITIPQPRVSSDASGLWQEHFANGIGLFTDNDNGFEAVFGSGEICGDFSRSWAVYINTVKGGSNDLGTICQNNMAASAGDVIKIEFVQDGSTLTQTITNQNSGKKVSASIQNATPFPFAQIFSKATGNDATPPVFTVSDITLNGASNPGGAGDNFCKSFSPLATCSATVVTPGDSPKCSIASCTTGSNSGSGSSSGSGSNSGSGSTGTSGSGSSDSGSSGTAGSSTTVTGSSNGTVYSTSSPSGTSRPDLSSSKAVSLSGAFVAGLLIMQMLF